MENKTYRQFVTYVGPALALAAGILAGCTIVEATPTPTAVVVTGVPVTPTPPAGTVTTAFTPDVAPQSTPIPSQTATLVVARSTASPTFTATPGPDSLIRQGDTLPLLSPLPSPTPPTPVAAPAPATPTPTANPTLPPPSGAAWRGEYYDNPDLAGEPVLVRDDPTIDFSWGPDSPAPGIPADYFSVRWTRPFEFAQEGDFRFLADVDDGVKLYLDGWLIIDEWNTNPYVLHSGVFGDVKPGVHTIVVEFFEAAGDAHARVWFEETIVSVDKWVGEYYNNPDFRDAPVLIREDDDIDFDWGNDEPESGMADDFSVRWHRTLVLRAGDYDFEAKIDEDDRVRIYLDNWLIIDEHKRSGGIVTGEFKDVGAGYHTIKVEYQDHSGDASIEVNWRRDD